MAGTMKSALGTVTTPLAQELVDNIMEYLNKFDILALRAVSRDTREKTLDRFLTKNFAYRRLMPNNASLQRFVDICNCTETNLIAKLKSLEVITGIPDREDEDNPLNLHCITTILLKLKAAKIIPVLDVNHYDFLCGDDSSTKILLKIIAEADFPVEDLTLSNGMFESAACSSDLDLGPLNGRLYSTLSNLRRFSVCFESYVTEDDLSRVSNILAASSVLEDFTLAFLPDNKHPSRGLANAFLSCQFKSLKIHNGCFHRDDLEGLLDGQRNQLTRLRFWAVRLADKGASWPSLLEKLAEKFNLDDMGLDLIVKGHSAHRGGDGRAEVQKGLLDLAAQVQELWDDDVEDLDELYMYDDDPPDYADYGSEYDYVEADLDDFDWIERESLHGRAR